MYTVRRAYVEEAIAYPDEWRTMYARHEKYHEDYPDLNCDPYMVPRGIKSAVQRHFNRMHDKIVAAGYDPVQVFIRLAEWYATQTRDDIVYAEDMKK